MNGERCKTCGYQEADHLELSGFECATGFIPAQTVFKKRVKCPACDRSVRVMQEGSFRFYAKHFVPKARHFGTNWNKPHLCVRALAEFKEDSK